MSRVLYAVPAAAALLVACAAPQPTARQPTPWSAAAVAEDDFAGRLAALEAAVGAAAPAELLRALIALDWDHTLHEHPETATYVGSPAGQDRWTDLSPEAIERRESFARRELRLLERIDRAALGEADRLNYDLFHRSLALGLEESAFPGELMPINQMGGIQQDAAQMLALMPATNVAQYENVLARLRALPTLVEQTIALLRRGLERGVTPPRITLRDVPAQVADLLTDEPLDSPLLGPFARMPESLPAGERERLRREAAEAYRAAVAPAFRRLHAYLTTTYLPGARTSIALRDLPGGEAWYPVRVRAMTTTELSPEEIHEIGLREVRRIRAQMDSVIAAAGFRGGFEEFLRFLRTDPRFYFDDPAELVRQYRNIAKKADPMLAPLFGTLPRLPYGVDVIPSYQERSQTTAYYMPGAPDAGRPAYYMVNTYDLKSRPKYEMEALSLHEAVPGHHLQIALAQELEDVPEFRRFGGYTAFVEGWGLYAESLGEEMGFYQDPYSKFGQLTYEMWRAVRLVVDTGMHWKGWSRQQAIDYFKANAGKTEHDIVVEIDRYIVWPAQALAYKIGELKIKELRAFAERQLGEAFDIRAFHDAVLLDGAVPLDVLDAQVRGWVAAEKAALAD